MLCNLRMGEDEFVGNLEVEGEGESLLFVGVMIA
jgi:hypothetical protein